MLNTTPATNGNTTQNNSPITVRQAPNNGKITVSYPNVILDDNPKITPSPTVRYLIQCKELGICQEFTDFDTAHTFAAQLAQDFPTATIDRYKLTQTFDDWDNETDTTQGGNV